MKNIIVLGAGMVGRAMAVDLSARYAVTAVDRDPAALKKLKKTKVKTIQADLSKAANISRLVKKADFVVVAVPGFMGYQTVEAVIKAGKNAVDISFFDEDAFGLDKLAKQHKVSVVVDCGVAPGMGNIIVGHWEKRMAIDNFEYLAAGLPVIRKFPFDYKAPFSPVDVVELYTRPARHRENGQIVIKPAMSETELIHFPEVGTLEAFATDGLRSLLTTSKIPNMVEKTMRYPGHIRLMQAFKEGGFFSEAPIKFAGAKIRPLDFTCRVMFDSWKLGDTDEEFTVMRATLTGKQNGRKKFVRYQVVDRYDRATGFSSMARTTGYCATAVAELILSGQFKRIGINPPEYVGAKDGCLDLVVKYLADRGVNYQITVK